MKISKFLFGNKVPKPSEDFIKLKLGYGATSTIGTLSLRVLLNQAALLSLSRADYGKYLKALKEGLNWAVTKSVLNRAMNPGSIKALPKDYKIEDGHIPTLKEINKKVELRQDPIKGIGLRNKEDWQNNRHPVKAILKSGVLYANPYTGALNAGYNLLNPETGVGATYNNFKNGNYLQGTVNGAFNLLDVGMMGNGVNKIALKLIPSYDLYNAIKNGTVLSEKLSPKILYRANVYKGGEIKNPRYSFFTTDEKYASQYGKVNPYIFESKNIAVAKEPLMGAKNPVNQDMMIYENTKNNPSANAIIGYDKVTGEFPYQSHGTEILNLDPNNIFPIKVNNFNHNVYTFKKPYNLNKPISIEKWTPEQWTAAQDAAIARGDMAEAQRLRDLHFQVSAPNTQIKDIQYHGAKGNAKFNVFDPKLIGQTDKGWAGKGYYFTPSKDYAKMYGSEPRAFYINAQKVHDGKAAAYFGREDGPEANAFKIIMKRRNNDGQQILDELASSDAIRTSFPQTQPYNGIFEEVVTRNNNQMKLADAVTYDDNGVRIPLGLRDNFKSKDIRYGIIPLTIGGKYLYNNLNNNK